MHIPSSCPSSSTDSTSRALLRRGAPSNTMLRVVDLRPASSSSSFFFGGGRTGPRTPPPKFRFNLLSKARTLPPHIEKEICDAGSAYTIQICLAVEDCRHMPTLGGEVLLLT